MFPDQDASFPSYGFYTKSNAFGRDSVLGRLICDSLEDAHKHFIPSIGALSLKKVRESTTFFT